MPRIENRSPRNPDEMDRQIGPDQLRIYQERLEPHRAQVFRFIMSRVGNRNTAEELTQEVLAHAYRGLVTFTPKDGSDPHKAWLMTIAANQISNYIRDSTRQTGGYPQVDFEAYNNEVGTGSFEERTISRIDALEQLQPALEKLSPDERTLLDMKYEDDLTIEEIAQRLGISITAAKSQLHRAREKLRELIPEDDDL